MPRANPSPLHGRDDVADALTATAGGTKAAAKVLTKDVNVITTCATAAASVLAPPAKLGASCAISNQGAASANVFAQGTDTINGVSTATATALAAGKTLLLFGQADGKWVGGPLG
jgi:hypothetical protein